MPQHQRRTNGPASAPVQNHTAPGSLTPADAQVGARSAGSGSTGRFTCIQTGAQKGRRGAITSRHPRVQRMSNSTAPRWRGLVDGEPVELELAEVREVWPGTYPTHWQIDRPGVQLASSEERARELHWPKVVELFVAARRDDAPLVAMERAVHG